MKKNILLFLAGIICGLLFVNRGFCLDNDTGLSSLTKKVMEAKDEKGACDNLEQVMNLYLNDHKYADFVGFLESVAKKKKNLIPCVSYYIALCRYKQLKYLEESQSWDEYFSQGNTYRDQITGNLKTAIDSLSADEPLYVYSRLLLWQFHNDQQDAFYENALMDLDDAVSQYAKNAKDLGPIKTAADKLFEAGQNTISRKMYSLYTQKLISSGLSDKELKKAGDDFYKQGNLELAENIYDVYINRISSNLAKDKVSPILIDIAKMFVYNDAGPSDPLYAEKLFQKVDSLGGEDIFDEQLLYMRALNLEKAKEYSSARDRYIDLVNRFPSGAHFDEAVFKIGILYAYTGRDIKNAKVYFEKMSSQEKITPQVISSIYQLGLLSQWEENFDKAKQYYTKAIEAAGDNFADTISLVKERIKEIEESRPIEYNLKTFMDVSLRQEYAYLDSSKVSLKCSPYQAKKDESINVSSTVYMPASGCMQVENQYLWSGHLGKTSPQAENASFGTSFSNTGTKEINLVATSPSGIVDFSLDMVDIR